MTTIRRLLFVCVALILVQAPRTAHALSVSGGDVPLPAKSVSGVMQTTWDAAYSDLLAADALAMCWTTQMDRGANGGAANELDGYLESLLVQMQAVSCHTTCSNSTFMATDGNNGEDLAICAYLQSREDPACNMDPATGMPKALDVSKLRNPSQTQSYVLPAVPSIFTSVAALRGEAQQELAYTELSLCMAEQLDQKLNTVQVAFASGDDLVRVQEAVRERALTAVYEYGVLGKTLASATQPQFPTGLNGGPDVFPFYLMPYSAWVNGFTFSGVSVSSSFAAANATQFGTDFAEAVRLLVDATESSIQLRLRDPAAQESFGVASWDSTSTIFQGMTGPREDLLEKVLYDGFDAAPQTPTRRVVGTDMSAPQVGVLLGLARSAGALKLHVGGTPQFDSNANASALLLSVENFVRNNVCTQQSVSPCTLATSATPTTSYLVWQRYGVGGSHALTLVDALFEGIFGPPTPGSRASGVWQYGTPLFTPPSTSPPIYAPAEQLTFHMFGHHQFTGSTTQASPVGDVIVDPNFSVTPLRAQDIQSMRNGVHLPVRQVDPNGNAVAQIGYFRFNPLNSTDTFGYPSDRRQLGSSTVLALAREALMTLSQASNATVRGIYTQAAPAVSIIENAIGARQVIVRQQLNSVSFNPTVCAGCRQYVPIITGSTNFITIDVLTKTADPFTSFAIGAGVPLAATLAQDAGTTTIWGTSQATSLAGLQTTPMTFTSQAAGYALASVATSWSASSSHGMTLVLKTPGTAPQYQHVFTGRPVDVLNRTASPFASSPVGPYGTAVTYGGRFAREAENAWKFEASRWSMPKYDGFGLPQDWTPETDASLLGGSAGETVEQHFVDRAVTAADDSVAALNQAFTTLEQDAEDDASIAAADLQAQQLTSLQYESLCGAQAAAAPSVCQPSYAPSVPATPPCSGPAGDNATCEQFRSLLGQITGQSSPGVPLATAVSNEIASRNPSPTFSTYQGGQLQGLFLAQWNAWNALTGGLSTAVGSVQSAISQVNAANADYQAAHTTYNAAIADIMTAYAQVAAQQQNFLAQEAQYQANQASFDAQVQSAQDTANRECSQTAFDNAFGAGFSYSGKNDEVWVHESTSATGYSYNYTGASSKTFSPATLIEQIDRCNTAQSAANVMLEGQDQQDAALSQLAAALQQQADADNLQLAGLQAHRDDATAHYKAALMRTIAVEEALAVQRSTSAQAVQAVYGQLLSTVAAIDEAYTQANIEAAKIALNQQQSTYDVRVRFGTRSRFQSYDLWRARALTENARRLALAARRAIESRYVVDLSTMNAPEPFVDAPALWADQIYAPDLKPPFALGLTQAPTSGSGIDSNAVKDYVNDLTLFLDGFSVQRPSAAAAPDAQVVQLPAPAAQVVSATSVSSTAFIDPASSGWSFYCPSTGTWNADPDTGTFTEGAPTWTLSALCGGQPPTLARLGFWLDPWGQLNGSPTDPPYNARYNVRAGSLAINLVGSGIRNCQLATDPSTCYAEPFLTYDLQHTGPVWLTDYNEQWWSLDVPQALIEGGKALAEEEWLDPVTNGFNRADVGNVARTEFQGQPIGGAYEITLHLTPDVQVEQIQRIQLLMQTAYWVRQQ